MGCHRNNTCYATTLIFMVPLIVLSSFILVINIRTENLEKIIDTPQEQTECYLLTYSFVKEQSTDERYLSLNSYLKSLKPFSIAIIVCYSVKIIYSSIFTSLFTKNTKYGANGMLIVYFVVPARIISFIPIIVCVILLGVFVYNKKSEIFMKYYEECSKYYGESFINNFSNIIKINIYTLCIIVLFAWEIIYHAIITLCIMFEKNHPRYF